MGRGGAQPHVQAGNVGTTPEPYESCLTTLSPQVRRPGVCVSSLAAVEEWCLAQSQKAGPFHHLLHQCGSGGGLV